MIPSLRPFLVLVLTLATTSVTPSLADDSNDAPDINKILGGQNGEVCRPYTCPKTYAPLPKWPLSIESAGCQGGMQQAKGMDFKHFEKCCDLQTMCYQVCGMTKEKCDADMEACMKKSCDELPGLAASYEEKQDLTEEEVAEESESCHRMVGLVKLIRGMNGCREYEMFQMRNCECVAKDKLVANMERVLRNFYKKYKPDGIGKVDSLVAKADGKTSNFAIILKQLITKYPAAIKRKKVEPRPPIRPKKMMNDEL